MGKYDVKQEVSDKYSLRGRVFHRLREDILSGKYQENEELKLAMGISENTHDLSIAIQKAETALQYTVAVRDKLLTAYNEIMQMQI